MIYHGMLPRLTLSPRDPGFVQDPYPTYARLLHAMPVFVWEDYGHVCVVRFDDVSAILRDRRFGREPVEPKPAPPHLCAFATFDRAQMLEREPPAHTRLRALVTKAFVSREVERLRPTIAALAHRLIDGFVDQGSADLLAAYATPIPVVTIAELLGVPPSDAPLLLDWSHRMVAMYQARRTRDVEDSAVAALSDFQAYLQDHVTERRRRPRDDLLSYLVAAEAAGDRLSENELIANTILLLNAGHEATVHAIGNGTVALLAHRVDVVAALATNGGAERLVEEVLRFDPPLHLFTRYAREDVTVAGASIKAGEVVGLLLAAANRDPARFAEPDRFDVGRPVAVNASFGAGIHFCLGAALARIEIEEAFRALFMRLPRLALKETPRLADTYHFRQREGLLVTW